MKTVRKHTATLNLPTLKLEGSLFLPDVLEKAASGPSPPAGRGRLRHSQGPEAQRRSTAAPSRSPVPSGAALPAAGAHRLRCPTRHRHFRHRTAARCLWPTFPWVPSPASNWASAATPSPTWPARRTNPFTRSTRCPSWWPRTPWAWTSPTRALPSPAAAAAKRRAFQLAQELLNASPVHQWALVSNGKTLRLLRDAATLTRPSYLEVDLQDLLAGQRFVPNLALPGACCTPAAPACWTVAQGRAPTRPPARGLGQPGAKPARKRAPACATVCAAA
jgi:hypothetical protein